MRWRYRYDDEHRLTEVLCEPKDRNRPQTQVSFRYDPLGRRISKTSRRTVNGQAQGKAVTTRFVWDGFRLLQEIHDGVPLTYVYSDAGSYEPLARIDGLTDPEIYWFHCQPNGTPERLTDAEGTLRWEAQNSAWGKLLRETVLQGPGFVQNLRMQGQYLDRDKSAGSRFEQRFSAGPKGASLMDEASIQGCIITCSGTMTRTAGGLPSRTR